MPVSTTQSKILIAGTRGIPHQHGGFESFAQHLALHLVAVGRNATVACQRDDSRRRFTTEYWHGVKLLKLPAFLSGPIGSIIFDLFTAIYAIINRPIVLTLGYNTAFIFLLYKAFRVTNIVNMDGVEWRRNKWSKPVKVWFYINERLAMWLGDVLVADHPVIAERLCHKVDPAKVVTIPYGAHRMDKPKAEVLQEAGLSAGGYAVVVARPEPENSILEIVQGFVAADLPGELVLLGKYDPSRNSYHRAVMAASNDRVRFLGAIYDQVKVETLRNRAWIYIHGHQVGGTNPSLVEALAAQCPVLAHDNAYNAWVAGPEMAFFSDVASCTRMLRALFNDPSTLARMRQAATVRFEQSFRLETMYERYLEVLTKPVPAIVTVAHARPQWLSGHGGEETGARQTEPPVR